MNVYRANEFLASGEPVNGPSSGIDLQGNGVKADPGDGLIMIVHQRALHRECLARSLQAYNRALALTAVGTVEEAKAVAERSDLAAILLIIGDRTSTDHIQSDLQEFVSQFDDVPVVLVADSDEPSAILAALDGGAKAYVSTNASVKVLAEAITLARSGGSFVPASCILGLKAAIAAKQENDSASSGMFTARQTAVAKALKQGKANKIIAYELNMCESTVKVHVRNIMKKLGATNRTQVAYKLTGMAA